MIFADGSMERSFELFRKKHLSFGSLEKRGMSTCGSTTFPKYFQRGEKELTGSVDSVYPKSWDYRLCGRELNRNFHLWGEVGKNVKKLFLTVVLKIAVKRKVAGVFMSDV